MMKRNIILTLLIFSIASILAACSDDSSNSKDGDVKEISFFHRFTESPAKEYFDGAVKRFEEENDDIKVKVSSAINEDYKQKINVLMSNEEPPDIFFTWSGEYSNKFARNNRALDLSEYVTEGSALKDQVIANQLEVYNYDGKPYGVPIIMDGKAFFYNKDLFKELGISEPKTWEEFLDALEVIKGEGTTPIAFGNQDNWAIGHYLTTLNQRIVNPDVLKADYDIDSSEFTDDGYVKALDKMLELGPYFTKMPNAVTDDSAINSFVSGEAAIYYNQFNQYPYIEPADFEIGWFNFPAFSDGEGSQDALTGSPQGFMVSAKTKHPDEAVKFLEFLTSPEEAQKMVEETGMISSSIDGVSDSSENEVLKQFVEMIMNASETSIWMDSAIDARVADVYLKSAQEMMGGQKSAEEVMEDVQKSVD